MSLGLLFLTDRRNTDYNYNNITIAVSDLTLQLMFFSLKRDPGIDKTVRTQ